MSSGTNHDFSQCNDLGLKVDEEIFWVNRRNLATCSPVFNAMLYGEFQESGQNIIDLPGKKPADILELLRCLFVIDGKMNEVTEENVEVLLQLADEYQISDLLKKCYRVFVVMAQSSTSAEIHKVMVVLQLALQHKLKDAVRAAIRNCSVFSIGVLTPYFPDLPEEVQHALSLLIAGMRKPNHMPRSKKIDFCSYGNHRCGLLRDGIQCENCKCAVCSNCNQDRSQFSSLFGDSCMKCGHCLTEIGSTTFVCPCIERLIIAQLEKIGM